MDASPLTALKMMCCYGILRTNIIPENKPDIVFRSWLFIQSWIRAKCSQIPPPTAFAVEGNSKGETPATTAAIAVGEKPALLSPDAIRKDTENFFAAHKERIRMLTLSRRKGYLRPPAKTRRSSRKCTLN
ncbi:hypothetical protein NPIL_431321 [Nephila pilipes]|uniref:Uncharacterized protein n=1 Tax=Nephila pilipes TaxID=299642 RepID=A0A8X6PA98_NEPPI|nr:hypothetical protein NPIL_431321 [Nephila pilipes]